MIISSVNTLTLVGLHRTCRGQDSHWELSVYKWYQCVPVHSVWVLLSVGGLQPLLYIYIYDSKWLIADIYTIYIPSTLHTYSSFNVSQTLTLICCLTQALIPSLKHTSIEAMCLRRGVVWWLFMEGRWGWAISGQLINHIGCRPLIFSTGTEESSNSALCLLVWGFSSLCLTVTPLFPHTSRFLHDDRFPHFSHVCSCTILMSLWLSDCQSSSLYHPCLAFCSAMPCCLSTCHNGAYSGSCN